MATPSSARKRPKQLPLPSAGLNNAPLSANPPATPTRTSAVQVGRNSDNFSAALSPPRSPTVGTHPRMYNSHSTSSHVRSQSFSSTHAGGVLPSASFFHPSRPSHRLSEEDQEDKERSSENALPEIDETELDNIHLQPIRHSEDAGGLSGEDDATNVADTSKKGGDLLASSDIFDNSPSRPSMSDPVGRLRGSIDRLRQGISFDSPRSTHINLPIENKPSLSEGPDENKRYSGHMESSHIPRSPSLTSRAPSFAPTVSEDPVWAVPIMKGKRRVLKYEGFPSRNRFFFRGRILVGGDTPWSFVFCCFIILLVAATWFAETVPWWWHNITPAVGIIGAYLCAIVISCMIVTAFSDPGILPRGLDPEPLLAASEEEPTPLSRDLRVRKDTIRVKYCSTCKTYRPPRSSHCKMCDNCVDDCDHHCQWVNNCVGRRNYTTFFSLLLSGTITLIFVIITSALHLYYLTIWSNSSFRHTLSHAPASVLCFCLSIILIWPVTALFSYHVRLISLNITTIEQIRNAAYKHESSPSGPPPNPFTFGSYQWRKNAISMLCRPPGYSWIEPTAPAVRDMRDINPGLVHGGGGAAWLNSPRHTSEV